MSKSNVDSLKIHVLSVGFFECCWLCLRSTEKLKLRDTSSVVVINTTWSRDTFTSSAVVMVPSSVSDSFTRFYWIRCGWIFIRCNLADEKNAILFHFITNLRSLFYLCFFFQDVAWAHYKGARTCCRISGSVSITPNKQAKVFCFFR